MGAAGGGHVRTASGETGLGGGNGAAAAAGTRRGVHSEDEDLHLVIDPAADTVRAAVASMRAQLEQGILSLSDDAKVEDVRATLALLAGQVSAAREGLAERHIWRPPKKTSWTREELFAIGATNISGQTSYGTYSAKAESYDGDYQIEVSGYVPSSDHWKFNADEGWDSWFYGSDPDVRLNGVEITILD